MAYTITEALAEIKTINKRMEAKCGAVGQYLARDARIKDPLERDGGSTQYIARERQALSDLEQRIVSIRTAIQASNLKSRLTVNGETRSVAEWLTWRRELATSKKNFLNSLSTAIRNLRTKVHQQGQKLIAASSEQSAEAGEVVVHVDEKALLAEIENLETTLGELDGKLSLANATTIIDV